VLKASDPASRARPAAGGMILPPDRTTVFAGSRGNRQLALLARVPGSADRHDGVPGNHLAAVPATTSARRRPGSFSSAALSATPAS